jgi:hypothetical protein
MVIGNLPWFDLITHPYLTVLIRWLLAGILIFAGASKVTDNGFVEALRTYEVLPPQLSKWLARALPFIEIALGAFLAIGLGTRIAAGLAALLFASFSIAVGINMLRGRELDCHCFGKLYTEKIGPAILLRNCILTLLAVQVIFPAHSYLTIDGWLQTSNTAETNGPPIQGLFPIALIVVGTLFMYLLIKSLLTIVDPPKGS